MPKQRKVQITLDNARQFADPNCRCNGSGVTGTIVRRICSCTGFTPQVKERKPETLQAQLLNKYRER